MKIRARFIALLLGLLPSTLPAVQWGSLDLRGQTELAWQYTPARDGTRFDPGGRIVQNPEQRGFLSQRLTPKINYQDIALRGDFWLQGQVDGTQTNPDFFLQKSAFDWYVNDNVIVSGGIDLQHWGPGYIWNPSNPFQDREINFEDRVIAYKRHGNIFAAFDWTGGDGWGAALYFVRHKPREKLYGLDVPYQSAFAVKLNKQFESSDVSLTYARLRDVNFIGGAYSTTIGSQLELHGEFSVRDKRRTVLPKDIETLLGPHYAVFQNDDKTAWRPQFLAGGQYTTENQINFIFEYLYNGEGYSEGEYARLQQDAKQSIAQLNTVFAPAAGGFLGGANALLGTMQQHYLFARVADTHLYDKLEGKSFVRYGLQDASVIVGGLLSYPLVDGLDVMLGGQYYAKTADSETASIPFKFVLYSGFTLVF